MGLQCYIGGSGAGKSERLYTEVIRQSMEEPDQRFFIIVPDQFTMQTQKELVLRHPKGGIMNIEVLSFGRLTHRIFEETGYGRQRVLDDTGKSLLLRKIAAQYAGELTVIGSHLKRIGYIHEVKSVLSEFMQYGITPKELEALTEYARQRGSLYYKLKDLGVLYRAFLEAVGDGFVTTEGRLGLLSGALEHSAMIRDSIVVFDGFTGFTPVQHQVIQKLLLLAREVKVAVIMDAGEDWQVQDGEQKLFAFSKKMIRSLVRLADEVGAVRREDILLTEKPVPRFRKNPSMAHLEQELFRYRNRPFLQEQHAVHIVEAATPKEEIRETCLRIRQLIRQEQYQYRDIAVVTGDLSIYADSVEEIFSHFDIPCYVDATRGIGLNPLTEYIRSAFSLLLMQFSYESVFRFLRSGLTGLAFEEIDRLENYVIAHGIRGRKKWSEQFVRRTASAGQETDKEKDREEMALLAAVNASREKLMALLSPLLLASSQVKDYVNHLYTFLTETAVYEKLSEMEEAFKQEGDLVRAKEYGQIYRLVLELLEQIYELIGEEEMSLQEFADILDAGFGEIQVGTIPQNVDRVLVGDMERTRLKEIKVLFFLGVNDGNIPGSSNQGGMISDLDREFLAEGQWEMAPSPRQKMYIQRLYLYMNMTKPSERLYLSYARVGGDGKAVRPSYLIGAVRALFPKLLIERQDESKLWEQVEAPVDGIGLLAGLLREYAMGNPVNEPFFFTLYRTYAEKEAYADRLEALIGAAFFRYQTSPLGKEIAHALYGSILTGSVSRLEQYASCAYSYFLEYGLSLQEREEFGFEAVDLGTLYHGILEQFSRLLEAQELDWLHFTREQGESLLSEAIRAQTALYGDTVLFSSARYQYVIVRLERILKRTIFTLQKQLQKGAFYPEQFEVSFSSVQELEAVNVSLSPQEKMKLQGRIDRIDTCREGNQVYVKIIDYKSGQKTLDIAAVYYGLSLQLVVYMNAAVELLGKKEPEKQIIPAAMLYYHVSDPMIRAEEGSLSEEALNEKIQESLRMSGIVNDSQEIIDRLDHVFGSKSQVIPVERKKDGSLGARSAVMSREELETVSNYVNQKLRTIGRQILQGEITKSPYAYGGKTGCEYCVYRSVCGFWEQLPGYEVRQLETLTAQEALQCMSQTLQQERKEGD